jgi:DNA-binding transcriptional MerR regulator
MLEASHNNELPPIPTKRYFTIGEVSELCDVKPHVLRYWEQEFPTLKPVKRAGNRRYYQRQDVILVREIRALLYQDGYTIGGARQKLSETGESTAVAMDKALVKNMIRELKELEELLRLTDI